MYFRNLKEKKYLQINHLSSNHTIAKNVKIYRRSNQANTFWEGISTYLKIQSYLKTENAQILAPRTAATVLVEDLN